MINLKPFPPKTTEQLNGWYQISNEVYHKEAPGASPSVIKAFKKSPGHCACRAGKPETQALFDGTAFHAAKLEPDIFLSNYKVYPSDTRFTQKLKKECSEKGLIPIKQDKHDTMKRMVDSIWTHPDASALFKSSGIAEASGFWIDPETGLQLKTRPDWISFGFECVIDLKKAGTSLDNRIPSSPEAFKKKLSNLDYHWSAWWQLEGLHRTIGWTARDFVWIVVEDSPPFSVGVYRASDAMLRKAQEEVRPLLEDYGECLALDSWPAESYGLQDIDLPDWG